MYKISLLCFKCINNIAPVYLQSLIKLKKYCDINIRNDSDFYLLEVPCLPSSSTPYRYKTFSYSGPDLWNKLPYEIRCINSLESFKSQLKTHYFKLAFEGV